jgi:hypothetical protein
VELDHHGNPRHYQIVHVEPEQHPVVVDNSPTLSPLTPVQPRSTAHVQGSYQDRAWGFSIKTSLLALVVGIGMTLGAYFIGGVAGAILLMYFIGGFLAVWLASFVLDTLASSEGTQLLETVFLWRYLSREQSERHRRHGAPQPQRHIADKVIGSLMVAWLSLVFLAWMLIKNGVI